MERKSFYEFLPSKATEMEVQEMGFSRIPSSRDVFINPNITQERNFLEQLEFQRNFEQLQEGDDHDHNDDADFHDHRPPQEGQWPIRKVLTRSDVDRQQYRLVLLVSHVGTFFPRWSPSLVQKIERGEKHHIVIRDMDNIPPSEHHLQFCRRLSNGLYVIQSNWSEEFVRRRGLREGDEIGLCWDSGNNCFLFSVLRRRA